MNALFSGLWFQLVINWYLLTYKHHSLDACNRTSCFFNSSDTLRAAIGFSQQTKILSSVHNACKMMALPSSVLPVHRISTSVALMQLTLSTCKMRAAKAGPPGEMVKGKENSSIPVSFAAKQEGGVSNVNTLLKRKGTAQERGQISIAKSAWAHAPTRASLTAMANALSSTLNSEQTHDRHASESCM